MFGQDIWLVRGSFNLVVVGRDILRKKARRKGRNSDFQIFVFLEVIFQILLQCVFTRMIERHNLQSRSRSNPADTARVRTITSIRHTHAP